MNNQNKTDNRKAFHKPKKYLDKIIKLEQSTLKTIPKHFLYLSASSRAHPRYSNIIYQVI